MSWLRIPATTTTATSPGREVISNSSPSANTWPPGPGSGLAENTLSRVVSTNAMRTSTGSSGSGTYLSMPDTVPLIVPVGGGSRGRLPPGVGGISGVMYMVTFSASNVANVCGSKPSLPAVSVTGPTSPGPDSVTCPSALVSPCQGVAGSVPSMAKAPSTGSAS